MLFDHSDGPRQVRSVNGYGARCGCGGCSVLHLSFGQPVSPQTSIFLCRDCVDFAMSLFAEARLNQPPYWPGDEDRDEPYAPPVDCPECDGEGEVEHGIRQDRLSGLWDTQTFRCTACDGTGRATKETA